MAANELVAHSSLKADGNGQHVCSLLGGFSPERGPTEGEQVGAHATASLHVCPLQLPGSHSTLTSHE